MFIKIKSGESWGGSLDKECPDKGEWLQTQGGRIGLEIRKKFITVRLMRHWKGLSKEVVTSHPWKCPWSCLG